MCALVSVIPGKGPEMGDKRSTRGTIRTAVSTVSGEAQAGGGHSVRGRFSRRARAAAR